MQRYLDASSFGFSPDLAKSELGCGLSRIQYNTLGSGEKCGRLTWLGLALASKLGDLVYVTLENLMTIITCWFSGCLNP